jgi:hypothetical protein
MLLMKADKDQINTLRKKHQVKSLYFFGSLDTATFSNEKGSY